MNDFGSNTWLRILGAVSLVVLALTIGAYSISHLLAPDEPMSGRIIGGLSLIGLTLPLLAGGLWIWTAKQSLSGEKLPRILGWCGAGTVPISLFSILVIIYQRQHGVVLAEPFGIVLWIVGAGTVGGLITGMYDIRRQNAYQRQQRTAERLSSLIDAAPVPIIEHELDGTVRQWNDAAERVFGWNANEVMGDRLPFISETDASHDKFVALRHRLQDGEQVTNVEIQLGTKDGGPRDFLLSTAPMYNDTNGDLSSIIGILVDISQQKRQRQRLELFRTLLDHSNDSIFVVDVETGEFIDVNETACDSLGYDRDELLKLSVIEVERTLSTEDDWRTHVETIREEGSVLYEGMQERNDGSTFPVEVNIAHVVLDQEYTVAIARDITERKVRERERTQFQRAVHHAGYAIYITDRDGTIEYANPAFEDITGYSPDEAEGRDPSILQSGEHGDEYYRRLWNTILDGQIWEEEVVNQRRSGERYTAHQTIAPIYEDETISGFVAIQSDMTVQQLREQRISVLNRILRHNLKNAVSVISGNADLLLRELEDAECRRYVNTIDDQAQTLAALSETAQSVTKALKNTRPPVHPISVDNILSQIIDSIGDEYSTADIRIDNQTLSTILVDASIKPALEELLTNALKHNDQPCPTVKISVRQGSDDKHVSIAVSDDGPGIPELDRRTISRDIPEEPLQHSSGMGLWLVKWLTTALGGTMDITDNDPRGSTVILTLPIISEPGCTAVSHTSAAGSGIEYETQNQEVSHDD
jgi:PAS domain S-box-containing protein